MVNNKKALHVSSSTAKVLSEYLLQKGIEQEIIEKTVQCSLSELETSDFRLNIRAYNELWNLAVKFTANPSLGLRLAHNPYNEEMGPVSHIFFNSPTLLAGLKQYERYYSLVNESMHIEIETDEHFAYVKYICDYPEFYSIADIEHSLALSILRVKENVKEAIDLKEVYFQHSTATCELEEYQRIFPCPIKFDQEYSALVFKKDYLEFKLVKQSAYLLKLLTKHIETLYSKIKPANSFSEEVSEILEKQLSVDCVDAEHIAEKLHMSRHTLYRKLKSEGIAFHELVDKIREEKAYYYLNGGKHSLSDIAFLLGFSELSAFSRAFKRWTGLPPAKYLRSINTREK